MTQADINSITISGTISGDVREADVGDGHVVERELSFFTPGKDGPKEQWIQLQAWGKAVGDALAQAAEGEGVIVQGSLNRRAWKDKEDNWQSRYSIRVVQIQELGAQPATTASTVETGGSSWLSD